MPHHPELKIRQKIMVARRGEREWFLSAVQDVREGECFIELPKKRESALVFYPGEEVEVRFTNEDATYLFSTRVLGRTQDQIPLFRLAQPESMKRVQQRRFVRLPVSLEIFYVPAPVDEKRRPRYQKAISADLSGSGVRLVIREPLKEGAMLHIKFSLPLKKGIKEISTGGKVVRSWTVETEGGLTHQAAVEFVNIGRTQQDYIVSFIFERMAEQGRFWS